MTNSFGGCTRLGIATVLAAGMTVGLTACDDSSPSEPESPLQEEVRQATSMFSSSAAASSAGYVEDPLCVVNPQAGAMGHHWVNQDLVDPEFDPLRPEVILYEPTANGGRRLIGVEYIVIDVGQPRPEFEGHPFDLEGVPPLMQAGVPHWSLHVWLYEENPSGVFAPYNPNVNCQHASAVHDHDHGGH